MISPIYSYGSCYTYNGIKKAVSVGREIVVWLVQYPSGLKL